MGDSRLVTTTAQRQVMHDAMSYLLAHAGAVHYAEVRPMRTKNIATMAELQAAVQAPGGITTDCSEMVTLLCHVAGLSDPNGLGYGGEGFTGTLLQHLPHYTSARAARVGALVVFGPPPGDHVAAVLAPDPLKGNPRLFSHGSEIGPLDILLSTEAAAHRPPVTFLSIAHL